MAVSRRPRRLASLVALSALVILGAFALTGCGSKEASSKSTSGDKGTVVVGSKAFTESDILAEVYALALEDNGYTVERKFDIASSAIPEALNSGDIDFYPEYTGTSLLSVFKLPFETDEQKIYDAIQKAYAEKGITTLDQASASDSQGLVITKKAADKYGIKTISDLQKNATKLRFVSQGEFDEREDGIPALEKAYGPFKWAGHQVVDNSLKYQVLANDKGDVAPAATTEGQLTDPQFVILEDDKHVWPPYNVVPLIRTSVLDKNAEIADIVNAVTAKIDTATLTKLNARVDVDKEDYADVAAEFYESIQ